MEEEKAKNLNRLEIAPKKLFLMIINDVNQKGLNVKNLKGKYPLSLGTIYRMKNGYASKTTISKARYILDI